ncbi:MAG: type II toxin-antitoxin system mRNA interferase toxin, RelE/StbE family [Candidatus Yonathbacteria bacterium]|nr:type II toxin-antitoxin system mRNA interferase toxin, RelE/StbE family [Candidatus Yonathbacteria bacterium]
MIVVYHRNFKKMLQKLPVSVQEKFYSSLSIFVKNSHHVILGNHALSGEWATCRSINITGDIRAVYKERDGGVIQFVTVGSHSELYS